MKNRCTPHRGGPAHAGGVLNETGLMSVVRTEYSGYFISIS